MPVETRDPYTGPVRAIDLERDTNTGRIYHLHRAAIRQCPPCTGRCACADGCFVTTEPGRPEVECCAPEGGKHADPVPSAALSSMRRHDRIRYRVALAVLLAVAAYLSHLAWPLLAA